MPTVGVRELKNRATQIVRAVREEQSEYVVTVDGRPVAVLRPYTVADEDSRRAAHAADAIARLREIVDKVSSGAGRGVSGVQSIEDERASRWAS